MSRKYSFIWLYFEEKDGKRAKCKFCKKTISFSNGSQSNLKRHLKLKHPLTSLNLEMRTPTSKEIIKLERPLEDKPSTSSQITTVTQQRQTTKFFGKTPSAEHIDVKKFDRQVLKMIAKGYHSLRFVEEPEFKNFISVLSNYSYNLPTRKTLLSDLLPSIHMEILDDIKAKLRSATDVSLTIDTWTSRANVSYVSVTAHYINPDTLHTSHLLACREFENTQAPENLYSFLKTVITDFKINNKITAIVSDHSPNIVGAIHQGKWLAIGCFACSLNLIVQAATVEIAETVNKVRKIFEYFRINLHDLKELQTAMKLMNLPELELTQDDPMRWNSTYEILQTAKQLKDALISILSLKNPNIMLTVEDWEVIGETMSILKPFYEVIIEISGEKDVTLSKVTVLCNLLENFIAKCFPFNEKIVRMVISLQRDLATCFGNLENEYLYAESTLLDPRFKRKGFKSDASYEQALKILRNKISSINLTSLEDAVMPNSVTDEHESIWEAYDLEFSKIMKRDNNAAYVSELENYLNEEYLDRRNNALLWWKAKKNIYPKLYLFAIKRFCIVATSVPCERIFTSTGQSISERRDILEPNEVEGLVFLHNNM